MKEFIMKIFRQITANNVEINNYPFSKELAMEAYLIENEDILKLDNNNFSEVVVLDAEVTLRGLDNRNNRENRIDILAKYGLDYLAIVELKKDEINIDTLNQLNRYLACRKEIEENKEFWDTENNNPKWVGVLAGTSISMELQEKLMNGYSNEDGIPIAGMVLKRFRSSTNEIFVITDTFFNYNDSSRDYSKYLFKGKSYNKPRLVNAVINAYVEDNPNIKFAELKRIFPKNIQGSIGVIETEENARAIFDNSGHKRHYLKADELVRLVDSTIATSNQWGIGNITKFVNTVNNLSWEQITLED